MIVIENLSKAYGPTPCVEGVDLTIAAGGVTSIIGPNGAGKSTLLSLVARLLDKDDGRISVDGLDIDRTKSEVLAQRLSILRQDNHIASRLTVRDLVGFGRYPWSHGRLTAQDHAKVAEAIGFLHLEDLADRFLDELSGGQRQRAHIAMVLCQDTDYVLLDEPLNNLDMSHARSLMARLRGLVDQGGRSVAMVVHEVNYAAAWADHVIALKDGRVMAEGPAEAVLTEEVLSRLYDTPIRVGRHLDRPLVLHHA